MKKNNKLKIFKLFFTSIIIILPSFNNGSCAYDDEDKKLIELIKNNFTKKPIELSSKSETDAINDFINNRINKELIENEIIFNCFNFIGKKDLSIDGNKFSDIDKTIIDLSYDGYCKINNQYFIDVKKEKNFYSFLLQGWCTIYYTKNIDSLNIKNGDYLQFIFDIQKNININVIQNDGYIDFEYQTVANFLVVCGFIKSLHNSKMQNTLSITNIKETNYSLHPFNYYHYNIKPD